MTAELRYGRVYYTNGGSAASGRTGEAIKDPPSSGWQSAIIVKGEKSSTILCPITLFSYRVPNNCAELRSAKPLDLDKDLMGTTITNSWAMWHRLGFQRDFDVAALVLTAMDKPVPAYEAIVRSSDEEPKSRGGKQINEEVLRPIKKASKRGAVAEFFLGGEMQPIREAMARLDLSRSGVLSHLFCINRDHGLGYELVNDCARLVIPEGFDVFAVPEQQDRPSKSSGNAEDGEEQASEPKRRANGKPIVEANLKSIPAPSKRADTAIFFQSWAGIAEAMEKFELTRSAVLSMLHQINKDNGFGYELNEDATQARLLVPENFPLTGAKQPRAKK